MKRKSKELRLVIDSDGIITTIYDDSLIPLMELGETTTIRASDVEPEGDVELTGISNIKWYANIRADNLKLGSFKTRQEALDAEVEYLQRKLGMRE